MMPRRISHAVNIGGVRIGGGNPVVVQSMTKTHTSDVASTVGQIRQLQEHGCEIVRVAVPDAEAATALQPIKKAISIPLVADIHFDHRLAIAALEAGVDGLRLNPGNISDPEHVRKVVLAAKERQTPIRIGVNAGSLPKTQDNSVSIVEQMVHAAMGQVRLLEELDFHLIKISLKAFDVPTTVEAYQSIASMVPYPLHLGITEAGTPARGSVRSAAGIGTMLYLGLGDTIRVSLTGDPIEEVIVGYEILKSFNLRERGATIVSCPTCGRCQTNLIDLAQEVERRLAAVDRPMKVAVMGCVVNGPGEARQADLGIACGKGKGAIFRKGELLCTVDEQDLVNTLMAEVDKLCQ